MHLVPGRPDPSRARPSWSRPGGPGAETEDAGRRAQREARSERLHDLITQCARGDDSSFAELYDLTSSRIYGLVLRVLRAPELAGEVTQEVYLEIWQQCSRYTRDKGSVLAWMTTIAHRRAVDRVRAERSRIERDSRHAASSAVPEYDTVWEGVGRNLDADRVRRALDSLTRIQREALSLAYFGGYTQSQVAQLLGLPLGTVKTRIRDGLIGLRDTLGVGA